MTKVLMYLIEYLKDKVKAVWSEATSGNEALELLKYNQFSLVISDINMRNGTGHWLHQEMKKEETSIPLLLFTSKVFNSKTQPILDNVLKAVIFKFDYEGLVRHVKKELPSTF